MASQQMGAKRSTIRDISSLAKAMTMSVSQEPNPSLAARFLEEEDDNDAASSRHHFLDECHMCGRYLRRNQDIYMYKGDTSLCSEDYLEENLRIDELQERANRKRRRAKAASASGSVSAQVETRANVVAVGAL